MSAPGGITQLMGALATADPTRPRLTWYGDGERVELSGRVLDNWVAKTANLLVEEFDAGQGTRITVDLPTHWRAVVWLLAIWSVGAEPVPVVRPRAGGPERVVEQVPGRLLVTAYPQAHPNGQVVAVALPALARGFGTPLAGGVLDYAAEVSGYGDAFAGAEADARGTGRGDQSLVIRQALLIRQALEVGLPARTRLLTDIGPTDPVHGFLAAYVVDGSVVLCPDLRTLSPITRESERITRVASRDRDDE